MPSMIEHVSLDMVTGSEFLVIEGKRIFAGSLKNSPITETKDERQSIIEEVEVVFWPILSRPIN